MHFPESRCQGQHVVSGHGVLAACTVENLGIAISPSTGHDFQVLLEVGPRHLSLRGYDNKSATRIDHPMDTHSADLFRSVLTVLMDSAGPTVLSILVQAGGSEWQTESCRSHRSDIQDVATAFQLRRFADQFARARKLTEGLARNAPIAAAPQQSTTHCF